MLETMTKIPQRIQVPVGTEATQIPAAGIGDDHLPGRNQQKHDGMHQCDDGALAVGKDGEVAHACRYCSENDERQAVIQVTPTSGLATSVAEQFA